MGAFRLTCPECKKRLRRVKAIDWHLPIEQIKWLYVCRHCCKGWIYHPLAKQTTEFEAEPKVACPAPLS